MSTQTGPGRWTVIRDVSSYLGGWALIFKQAGILFAPPLHASETLIWVAGLLIGVPGLLQLVTLKLGTGVSPSSPQPPQSGSSGTPSPAPSGADA